MVTISDIAAALGVTPSTVSRALSGSPRVKEETRLAVEQMAAALGYERNVVASNLRKGKSDIVGIIVPRIHREFFANCIGGAEAVLNAAGYNVLICQTHEQFDAEVKALRTLRNNRVAGVLMSHAIGSMDGSHILETLGDRIPLVQFDRVFGELPGAKVVSNNAEGAYQATKHLIEHLLQDDGHLLFGNHVAGGRDVATRGGVVHRCVHALDGLGNDPQLLVLVLGGRDHIGGIYAGKRLIVRVFQFGGGTDRQRFPDMVDEGAQGFRQVPGQGGRDEFREDFLVGKVGVDHVLQAVLQDEAVEELGRDDEGAGHEDAHTFPFVIQVVTLEDREEIFYSSFSFYAGA